MTGDRLMGVPQYHNRAENSESENGNEVATDDSDLPPSSGVKIDQESLLQIESSTGGAGTETTLVD